MNESSRPPFSSAGAANPAAQMLRAVPWVMALASVPLIWYLLQAGLRWHLQSAGLSEWPELAPQQSPMSAWELAVWVSILGIVTLIGLKGRQLLPWLATRQKAWVRPAVGLWLLLWMFAGGHLVFEHVNRVGAQPPQVTEMALLDVNMIPAGGARGQSRPGQVLTLNWPERGGAYTVFIERGAAPDFTAKRPAVVAVTHRSGRWRSHYVVAVQARP